MMTLWDWVSGVRRRAYLQEDHDGRSLRGCRLSGARTREREKRRRRCRMAEEKVEDGMVETRFERWVGVRGQ